MQGDVENLGHIAGAIVVSLAALSIVVSFLVRGKAERVADEVTPPSAASESSARPASESA
jgi:hypothetical protein